MVSVPVQKRMPPGSRMTELWAWLAVSHEGTETVLSVEWQGVQIPMIAQTRERVEIYREHAEEVVRQIGISVLLVRWGGERTVQEILGAGGAA